MATLYLKQTDLGPKVETQLCDPDGNPIDLTGKTIQFQMKRVGRVSLTVDDTGVDEGGGVASYIFTGSQTIDWGVYRAHWIINQGLPSQETYPNYGYDIINIERNL